MRGAGEKTCELPFCSSANSIHTNPVKRLWVPSLAASRHTPGIGCPFQLHVQSRVSQNRMLSSIWQSALSLLGLKANQGSLSNKVSLSCQSAVRRVLLQRLVYSVVFVRGFHHRTFLIKACAQVGNGVQAITGDPVHFIQASVLTVLVFFVPKFGYTISSAS